MRRTWSRRFGRLVVSGALGVLSLASPAAARADLTPEERSRLAQGETVARPRRLAVSSRRYVGGVSYAIVDARHGDVLSALLDVRAYRHLLPRTLEVEDLGVREGDRVVRLRQGNAATSVRYACRIRYLADRREVKFWLDRSEPAEIDDMWGYFRAEPLDDGRTLLTYAAMVDLGPGLARLLYEDKVMRIALFDTPLAVRRYLEARPSG